MATTESGPIVLHADPEHTRLRTAVVAFLVVVVLIAFGLVRLLINQLAPAAWRDFSIALSCAGALPLGLVLAWLFERYLKSTWHSGEQLTLDNAGIHYQPKSDNAATVRQTTAQTFRWADHLNTLCWFFNLSGYPRAGREKRLPKQWLCLACELQQDEQRLAIYTYMPPRQAAKWTQSVADDSPFTNLAMDKLFKEQSLSRRVTAVRPKVGADLLRGKNGRFWLAEQRRWRQGVELTHPDFEIFMQYMRRKQPNV